VKKSTPLACWHLYIIRTVDQSIYAGISTDVQRRFKEHQAQGPKTAKFLLAHKPQSLAFSLPVGDRSLALKIEYHFKRLSKKEKERVVVSQQLVFDRDSGKIRLAE
jgi:putative endonuclease